MESDSTENTRFLDCFSFIFRPRDNERCPCDSERPLLLFLDRDVERDLDPERDPDLEPDRELERELEPELEPDPVLEPDRDALCFESLGRFDLKERSLSICFITVAVSAEFPKIGRLEGG